MMCPNCGTGTLNNFPGDVIAKCDQCGYLLEPRAWGLEKAVPTQKANDGSDYLTRLEFAIQKLLDGFRL